MARLHQDAFLKLDTGTHTRDICQLIVTPDGRRIISAGDTSVRVWDAQTLQLQRLLLSHVARPPDQSHLYGHVLRMALNPADGRSLVVLKHPASPKAFRQGGVFATEVQVFDIDTGNLQARYLHRGGPRDLDFSPDGRLLALACRDGLVELHAAPRVLRAGFDRPPQALQQLPLRVPAGQPRGRIFSAAVRFVPAGSAAAGKAGTYRLVAALSSRANWHDRAGQGQLLWFTARPRAGMQLQRVADVGADIDPRTLAVSAQWAVVAAWNPVHVQEQPSGLLRAQTHEPGAEGARWVDVGTEYLAASTAFSPSGARLLVGLFAPDNTDPGLDTYTAQAYTVSAQGLALRSTYHGHDHTVAALAFLDDKRAVSAGGDSQAIHLWDAGLMIGQRLATIRGVGRTVFNVAREGPDTEVFDTVPERTMPHSRLRRQRSFNLRSFTLGFTEPRVLPPPRYSACIDWSGLQIMPIPPVIPVAYGTVDHEQAAALTLFVGSDDEWVLWTASGYYDASPLGAQRIGYHVNRGEHQEALFLPSDRLKGFYRPDIVRAVLRQGSEAAVGVRRLDVMRQLPPVIERQGDPSVKRGRVELRFTVQALGPGEPPTRVFVLRNGRYAWQAPHAQPPGGAHVVRLPLGPGRNVFSIRAENAGGRAVPVDCTVDGPPTAPRSGPDEGARGQLFLLSVGVSNFKAEHQHSYEPLKAPHRDATAVYNALACGLDSADVDAAAPLHNAAFDAVQARLLVNAQATKQALADTLAQFRRQLLKRQQTAGRERDLLLIFLAGHGVVETTEGELYFLNHDLSFENMELTGVAFRDLGEWVADVPAEVVFIIDACHSQMAAPGLDAGLSPDAVAAKLQQANERSLYVLSAARADQKARENVQHGVFTQALLDTWRQSGDAPLTLTALMAGLQAGVPRVAAAWGKDPQTPVFRLFGDLLPLTLFRR